MNQVFLTEKPNGKEKVAKLLYQLIEGSIHAFSNYSFQFNSMTQKQLHFCLFTKYFHNLKR